MSLFTDFSKLVAILEKDVPAFIELKDAVVEVIADLAPNLMHATGEDFQPLVARCEAACAKHAAKMSASAEPAGKLFPGDGSFFKALLAIILQLLPLLVAPPAPV